MTDDDETPTTPVAAFARQFQEASEDLTAQQMEWFERMMAVGTPSTPGMGDFRRMSAGAAVFKTRVQSGGRISIPDAEREALGISEGDLVQAFVIPLDRATINND